MTVRPHLPYALLTPVVRPIPADSEIILYTPEEDLSPLDAIWEESELGEVGALTLDLETKGLHPEFGDEVVGISFADDRGAIYVDLQNGNPAAWEYLLRGIFTSNIPLAAYNVGFDAAFIMRDAKKYGISKTGWANWKYDAYLMFRHLSTEGWAGQSWGLKQAQVNLLGWELRGDEELVAWLVDNGWSNSAGNARKSEMWRAPPEILGKYCALDSYSTKELLEHVFLPVHNKFPILPTYHVAWLAEIEDVVHQQLRGLAIDRDRLSAYQEHLSQQIKEAEEAFRKHPDVKPHLDEYEQYIIDNLQAQEPTKYKKRAEPKAPKQKFRKDGTISKAWVNYEEKLRVFQETPREETTNWRKWQSRMEEIKAQTHFNLNSTDDKRWLFYDKLGFEVKLHTDSGLPAVDNKALLGFGEIGKMLKLYNDRVKESSYVAACLAKSERTGRLHPHFKTPATLTGRLGGTDNFNLQQQSKTPGYLSCIMCDPGNVLVDTDVSALEPHILAGASGDKTLMGLYGPEAPTSSDVYIEVGSRMAGIGQAFLDRGYVPGAPTVEAIKKCKAECKNLRGKIKVLHLACSYGAGAKSVHQSLQLAGDTISFEEVKKIYNDYWELFSDIKQYEKFLLAQWERNGGWVLNPLGRPIGVDASKLKDIINRCIQSAGHDALVFSIAIFKEVAEEYGLKYYPYITDFHDEQIIEVAKEDAELAKKCFQETYRRLNDLLKGPVQLKGEPDMGRCLAAFKIEGFSNWLSGQSEEVQGLLTPPSTA